MIYTLGHKVSYDAGLEEMKARGRPLLKVGRGMHKGVPYEGGSVWRTREDAEAYMQERAEGGNPLEGFAVYGLEADWRKDTVKAPGDVGWRSLKRDAAVIALEDA